NAGVNEIGAVARRHLGERLDVLLEEGELERALLSVLAVRERLPHPRRRVVVAGPLEELDRAVGLGGRVELRALRGRRCRRLGGRRGGGGGGGGGRRGRARPARGAPPARRRSRLRRRLRAARSGSPLP